MIRTMLITALLMFFFGCADRKNQDNTRQGDQVEEAVRVDYLALGDSYTVGEGVDEKERWPIQLARAVSSDTLIIDSVRIVAQTGWTTADLLEGIEKADLNATYDVVSLLIGVNNQYQGQELGIYKREFDSLVRLALDYAGDRERGVFVLSIPDYGVTPFAASRDTSRISREIQRYNAVADSICRRYAIPFFNITTISCKAGSDSTLLAPDKLHPSGKQYRLWVEAIEDSVRSILMSPAG